MWRFLKWLAIGVFVVLFLLTAGLGLAYYFKADILAAVNRELSKNINGEISVGDIDFTIRQFPAVSIVLSDMYLRGTQYDRYHKDFFASDRVEIDLHLRPLLHKEIAIRSIRVKSGNFYIFRTQSGYTNLDVFKNLKSTDSANHKSQISVTFGNIKLNDVRFLYYDSLKKKSIDLYFQNATNVISYTDSSRLFALQGAVRFGGIMLNAKRGMYLKEKAADVKLYLEYDNSKQALVVKPSSLKFPRSTITLSGNFSFSSPGGFILRISSSKLNYNEGLSLLTQSLQHRLSTYKVERPVELKAIISGKLAPGANPNVDIGFSFRDNKVVVGKISARKITVNGKFTNHADNSQQNDDRNSLLTISSFQGSIGGLPSSGTATIRNLEDPFLELKSTVTVNLPALNAQVDTRRIFFQKGKFLSTIEYSGRLNEYLDKTATRYHGKLKGTATIRQASFLVGPRRHRIEKFEMATHFDQRELSIERTSFLINKSPVTMTGEILGFIPFFIQPARKGYINLSLYSKKLDLTSLLSAKSKKGKQKVANKTRKSISEMVDRLYEKTEFAVALKIDELQFRNFKSSSLKGDLILADRSLKAKNLSMDLADGNFKFSLNLNQLNKPVNPLAIEGTVANADINKVLFAFDNFNQRNITYNNLRGKINMKIKFSSNLDDDFNIITNGTKSTVDLSIKNGRLLNYEPLQHMSNFLLKKRDFDNVKFAEIKTRFTLRGKEVNIKKMEIESSVLRLFLEGRYSFANRTDLSVQIPLSNLRKRDKNYKPQNVGVNTKQGLSIFLHIHTDANGKTIIDYDPFKKYVKSR